MQLKRRYHVVLAMLTTLVLLAGGGAYYMTAHSFSAHDEPTFVEAAIARRMRHMGVSRDQHNRANPVANSPEADRGARTLRRPLRRVSR
jgi:hypothetical protein